MAQDVSCNSTGSGARLRVRRMRPAGCGAPFAIDALMQHENGDCVPRVGLEAAPEPAMESEDADPLLNDRLRRVW